MMTKGIAELREQQRRKEIPHPSKFLAFNRFNRDYLKRSQLLKMQRNRVVVADLLHKHHVWLDSNCQDIFTYAPHGEWGHSEVLFLSEEDLALFVLAFA